MGLLDDLAEAAYAELGRARRAAAGRRPRRPAAPDPPAGAAAGGARRGGAALGAVPRARAGPRRAGHRLARPALGGPARARAGHPRRRASSSVERVRPEPALSPRLTLLVMDAAHVENDLVNVLFTEAQIQDRLGELAREIERDYEGKDLLIVGILRGAVMVMADLARSFSRHVEMDWMAVSLLRLGHQVQRRRADPQGPRHRHLRAPRGDRRRDHRHRAHAVVADLQPRLPQPRERRDLHAAAQARGAARCRSTSSTSAGTSPTSSSSATASTTSERYRNLRDIGTLAPHVYS